MIGNVPVLSAFDAVKGIPHAPHRSTGRIIVTAEADRVPSIASDNSLSAIGFGNAALRDEPFRWTAPLRNVQLLWPQPRIDTLCADPINVRITAARDAAQSRPFRDRDVSLGALLLKQKRT